MTSYTPQLTNMNRVDGTIRLGGYVDANGVVTATAQIDAKQCGCRLAHVKASGVLPTRAGEVIVQPEDFEV
ncbi:hypothetical protein ABZ379_28130 [Streptomyces canus]|uniref:hypothetical protein n=1 Tax=Streptomyces canus TaxID=58343 RepID=UPI0033E9FC9D